jgi:lipoprotein-releasing system ATP-binding protein
MLVAENLIKSYGDLKILKGVNLFVNQGEIVSIVGASGAGKTTLLNILGTLDQPDSGELLINGENPFKLPSKGLSAFRNQHIGFVFQFHQLLPEFSAVENVLIPSMIKGTPKKEAEKRAMELLELVGLKDRSMHKPSELSGGEQQRIAICRALMNQPDVILADEPSGNLDSKNALELHQLFFTLREAYNQTFILVTHNETLANQADRKLEMKDGIFV